MIRFILSVIVLMLCTLSCKRNGGFEPEPMVTNLDTSNLRIIANDIPQAPYTDLTFTDEFTGYAVSRNGRIMKTINAGVNWKEQKTPTDGLLKEIQFTDSQTGYILGSDIKGTFILKTENGGGLWQKITFMTWEEALPKGMYFVNNSVGFVCGGKNFIKTEDGGKSWKSVLPDEAGPFNDVKFNGKKGYLTTANKYYYNTTDGGKTWKQVKTNEPLDNIYFSLHHDFAVQNQSKKIIELNSGTLSPLPAPAQRLLFIDDKKCIGVGQHFEEGFWPFGDILLTNDLWNSYQQKKYIQSQAIEVTAAERLSADKTMMIGNAFERPMIVTLTHPRK